MLEIKHYNLSIISTDIRSGRLRFRLLIKKTESRDLNAKTTYGYFLGMQSNERLCWVYEEHKKKCFIVRLTDFKPCKQEKLPGVTSLLDVFTRQRGIDEQGVNEVGTEEGILKALK